MCRYMDYNGKCAIWDDDDDCIQYDHILEACDEYGYCLVDDDEDPSIICEDYQK